MKQRPIKFRAWDNIHKCFDDTIAANILLQMHEPSEDVDKEYGTRFFLMQFTGLHDKNGKEIYESDIVQHEAWDYPFEIIFNQEYARFVCKMKSGLSHYIDHVRMFVVGNVYETPHLLNNTTPTPA